MVRRAEPNSALTKIAAAEHRPYEAEFVPQDSRDQPIEGKEVDFDITRAVLGGGYRFFRYFVRKWDVDRDMTDSLADDLPERQAHDGPFEVYPENVEEWLAHHGLDPEKVPSEPEYRYLCMKYSVAPDGSE